MPYQMLLSSQVVILSSLAVLLPGFQLTLSLMEITSRSVNSGTTRLLSAVMDAFFQAFGAWIGISVYNVLEPGVALNTSKCFDPINPWFYFLVFPILSMAINVQFGASWRHMPICVMVNAAAFVVVYFMSSVTTSSILPVGVAGMSWKIELFLLLFHGTDQCFYSICYRADL
jgi:uncharacterized membrane protein YjjP (DUF1212 family)